MFQLMMPMAHDQPDNAARVKRFGVGDWLKPNAFRGPAVAKRLTRLLDNDDVRRDCAEIAERLKQDYDVKATPSSISHAIHRGTIRLQRA